jgi:hypothetical protein
MIPRRSGIRCRTIPPTILKNSDSETTQDDTYFVNWQSSEYNNDCAYSLEGHATCAALKSAIFRKR